MADTGLVTELCFLSPRGEGLKWLVRRPDAIAGLPFREQFEWLRRYVGFHYGVDPDPSGSDVTRTCYLPYDPLCFSS